MVGGTHRVGGTRLRAAVLATVLLPGVLAAGSGTAQAGPTRQPRFAGAPEWRDAGPATAVGKRGGPPPDIRVRTGRRLVLERSTLAAELDRAPHETAPERVRRPVLDVPTPEGRTARFTVAEAPVVAPSLGRRHPETRTYVGTGIDDPAATVSLDLGPAGFHAQVRTPRGGWYVDPETRGDDRSHIAYRRADLVNGHGPWREIDALGERAARAAATGPVGPTAARTIGPVLRTYRLALATTGEYSTFHGGTVSLVHNALVTAVNRLNGIFRPELGIQFQLVPDNDALIRLDPATDGYTNNDGDALIAENQARIDAVVGTAGYDIGHVFSTGGGGKAGLGVVGLAGQKARGETGSNAPTGDAFWVDYVAHEIGHQFGAEHTFSGIRGGCGGNGAAAAAMEPGSGSTIMGYAGVCDEDNLQDRFPNASSDPHFHARSFDQVQAVVANAEQGGAPSATGNSAPTVAPTGTTNRRVPPRTPFVLAATATDANAADAVSLQWEQYDGGALRALTAAPKNSGALFRSFPPTVGRTGSRTFPRLTSILANRTNAVTGTCPALPGGLACWSEFLPTSARTLKFRATVRDNRASGGGVANADTTVTVVGTTPFRVTSQNAAANFAGGAPITVTWNTAGTTAAPFNIPTVDIRITVNGGSTYTTLAASTPNDGSHTVTLPKIPTTTARIQVRAVGGIFFDLNDANLAIRVPAISVGDGHACALGGTGGVKCWGDNSYGELGNGTSTGPQQCSGYPCGPTAAPVSSITSAIAVASGNNHTCVLVANAMVKCWGANGDGQLGTGSSSGPQYCGFSALACSTTPVAVTGIAGAIALDAGGDRTCAVISGGTVKCWGSGSPNPVAVAGLSGVTAISVGGFDNTCATVTGGAVRCWGDNSFGQLGIGSTTASSVPVTVSGVSGATSISAGGSNACAVVAGGAVRCWGSNSDGQLGIGDNTGPEGCGVWNQACAKTPVTVTGLTGATTVTAQGANTCARLGSGTVQCWGNNFYGQLGIGTSTGPTTCQEFQYSDPCAKTPVTVNGFGTATTVSTGGVSVCTLLAAGSALCWGYNGFGQIGNGSSSGPQACGPYNWACAKQPVTVVGFP